MAKRRLVQCPLHELHYDPSKQDGCILCLKDEEKRNAADVKPEYFKGVPFFLIMALMIGLIIWTALEFGFPVPEETSDPVVEATLSFWEPFGWDRADRKVHQVVLERMGLRGGKGRWEIIEHYSMPNFGVEKTPYVETLSILKGAGADFISEESIPSIRGQLEKIGQNSARKLTIQDEKLIQVEGVPCVQFDLFYETNKKLTSARAVYLPGGLAHFWIIMKTLPHEWKQFEPTFDQLLASVQGAAQGEGTVSKLPNSLSSPYRAAVAGIISAIFSFWIMLFVSFSRRN
jgi:hypothetical protein